MTKDGVERLKRYLVWFAWWQLVVSIAGWPVSALTFAKGEPQAVLGLSWFAIIQGAIVFIVTAYIAKYQETGNGEGKQKGK
jgi:hypothetical protein